MTRQNIEKIMRVVETAAKSRKNYFTYGAWTHHMVLVAKNGKMLARKLGADEEIVELACWLHDYASFMGKKELYKQHHKHSAIQARKLLTKFEYPEEKIKKVEACIISHRGSVPSKKLSLEAKIVADADALSHFDVVYSLFYLAYSVRGLGIEEGRKFVLKKLSNSYKKMSPLAKSLAREKYQLVKKLFSHGQEK